MGYSYWNRDNPSYTSSTEMARDSGRFADEYERLRRIMEAEKNPKPATNPYSPPSGFGGRTREQAGALFNGTIGDRGRGGVGRSSREPGPIGNQSRGAPSTPIGRTSNIAAPPTRPEYTPPGRSSAAPALSSYSSPTAPDSSGVRGAIGGLGPIKLGSSPRAKLGDAPGRVGALGGLPDAPDRVGAYESRFSMPGREGVDRLIGKAEAGTRITPGARSTLGGPRGDNAWEQSSLSPQFEGHEIRQEVYTPEQEGVLAGQRSAATVRALEDMRRDAADSSAGGGGFDPARAAAAGNFAKLKAAGAVNEARGSAMLDATAANAEQEQAWAENSRRNFSADLDARLGLGKLGMERRGLDQGRDIAGFEGDIKQRSDDLNAAIAEGRINADTLEAALSGELSSRALETGAGLEGDKNSLAARGQDVAMRGQELDYAAEGGRQGVAARGQDVAQRGQEMDFAGEKYRGEIAQRATDLNQKYLAAGLNAEQARARVQAELGLRDADMNFALETGRQGLAARGQDASYNTANRGMDIDETLGLGRLDLDKYKTDADLGNAAAERQTRLDMLDKQLADASLDRASREKLETQRQDLERELQQIQTKQRESEFSRALGFQESEADRAGGQFGRTLDENQRQFDEGLGFDKFRWDVGRADARPPPPAAPSLYSWGFGGNDAGREGYGGGGNEASLSRLAREWAQLTAQQRAQIGSPDHLAALMAGGR